MENKHYKDTNDKGAKQGASASRKKKSFQNNMTGSNRKIIICMFLKVRKNNINF